MSETDRDISKIEFGEPLNTTLRKRFYPRNAQRPEGYGFAFGNSGIYANLNLINSRGTLHFLPEMTKDRPQGFSDEDFERRTKYARMFAVGMLELITYLKNLKFEKVEKELEPLQQNSDYLLDFSTNKNMADFARRTLGSSYFVKDVEREDKAKEEGSDLEYIVFHVGKLINDLDKNPGLLDVAKRFADPDKIKEIKVIK